jgi:hypothetical protein
VCKLVELIPTSGLRLRLQVFEENFTELLTSLNETVMSIPSLSHDRCFHPFTQPILYGKMEYLGWIL